MNLALHHFIKEARYVSLRWCVFLLLLALDLAVNLEWLFPLGADFTPPQWLDYLSPIIGLVALSLLPGCPEDRPGQDRSFVSTRPLPLSAYWMARVAVWLALLVLPYVLQNGLYLALSHRPWSDVMRGMWERGWTCVSLTVFVLPLSALLRWSEAWWMAALVGGTTFLVSKIADAIGMKWASIMLSQNQSPAGWAAGFTLFGIGAMSLTWWHQRRRFGTKGKAAWLVGMACVALANSYVWPFGVPQLTATDEARVKQMSGGLKIEFDLPGLNFDGFEKEYGRFLNAYATIETGQRGVHATLRDQNTRVSQTGRSFASETNVSMSSRRYGWNGYQSQVQNTGTAVRDLFPAGTLFSVSGPMSFAWEGRLQNRLAQLVPPFPDPAEPLRIETNYDVDWFQRDLAIDIPVTKGSHGACENHAWTILRVQENTTTTGPQQGSLTLDLRWDQRVKWNERHDVRPVLYSPERQLVWLNPVQTVPGASRASATSWLRSTTRLQWNNVLNHADGESTGVHVENLRLILLRCRYLGTSQWSWKSPDMRLNDYTANANDPVRIDDSHLYKGREVKAFQERLATLKPPTADTPEIEVRRYLYDLIATIARTRAVYQNAAFADITKAFRPLGEHHLPLLLSMPDSLWPGWSNRPPSSLLDTYLTDAHREEVIDLASKESHLARTLIKKGWVQEARRLQPDIIKKPQLSRAMTELLIAWDDEASHERLITEQQRWPRDDSMEALDKTPALRPRLEAIARDRFAGITPVIKEEWGWDVEDLALACDFGSREALDICLRWIALGGDMSERCGWPRPKLLDRDGTKLWKEKVDSDQQWPRYRHLKTEDFDYLPDQRAWKLRNS